MAETKDGGPATDARTFTLGAVLTGITGMMLCPIDDVYALYGFLTGGPVWTHELASLFPVVSADLRRQHPDLPTEADVNRETWKGWLAEAVERHGPTRECVPIPDYARTADPVTTLSQMLAARESR